MTFQPFDFESTWWSLFQKHVVRTKFDIYVFFIFDKYTSCLSNSLALVVPEDGLLWYSGNASCALNLISTFFIFDKYTFCLSNSLALLVPDERLVGYSRNASCVLNLISTFSFLTNIHLTFKEFVVEYTWWRIFQKSVVCTKLDFFLCITVQ